LHLRYAAGIDLAARDLFLGMLAAWRRWSSMEGKMAWIDGGRRGNGRKKGRRHAKRRRGVAALYVEGLGEPFISLTPETGPAKKLRHVGHLF